MRIQRRLLGQALAAGALAPALARPALAQPSGTIGGPLVLYTSQLEPDAAQTVEAFRRRHPGVAVEWIRAGTGQIMTRLRAEIAAGSPRPDLLLLADSLTFEALRSEGRLRPSPEVPLGGTPPEQVEAGRSYFGTKLITTGIIHHLRAPFVPRRWTDLLDPRARNQVAMPSPAVSGAAAIHLAALEQQPGLGWDFVERLVRQGVQARGGNGPVMQAVAGAERAFGIAIDYLPIREAARGAPVRFVFPEEGVSAITEPAAILSTARNVPAAVAFLGFLLSREGQELASRQGFLPIDPEVAPPPGFPDPRSIRVMPFDAARAAAGQEAMLRRFAQLTGGEPGRLDGTVGVQAAARGQARAGGRAGAERAGPAGLGHGIAAAALAWLLLVGALPLLRLLAEATSGHVIEAALTDPAVWRAAWHSLVIALAAAALATLLGGGLAWALLLRGLPGFRPLVFLAVLPALVPAQVMALGWIQAGGPASPLLLALGLAPPIGTPNPVYSEAGMVAILAAQASPLVLLAVAALLRRVPGEVVLAARGLGAGPEAALRRAVWPLLAPGLLAGAGLAYVAALGNFGVGALIGIPARVPVLPVLIWQRLSAGGSASLAQAAALALLLAAMAAPALLLQAAAARRAPASGRLGFERLALRPGPQAVVLGAVLAWLLLVLVVPMLALVAAALVPAIGMELGRETATLRHFLAALAPGAQTARAFGNSLLLSVGAALLLAAAALPIALVLRARAVRLAAGATDLPYALPGACTGVAAILVVLSLPGGGALYGTLGLILFAYLTRFQALALRPAAAAAARLDPLLDDAARGLGAGPWRRLWQIHLPPLAPALAAGGILVALTAVNEVTVSSLLYGPGTQTLGVLVFGLQESGQSPLAAAVSCLALLLSAALMALASLAARRLPAGTLPWRP